MKKKNKKKIKTDSNYKKSTPTEIKKHKEQIAGLIESLNDYDDHFHRVEQRETLQQMLKYLII